MRCARRSSAISRSVAALAAAAALAGCGSSGERPAPGSPWERSSLDQEEKPWVERQVHLPPFPQPRDLVSFYVGGTFSHRYSIDAASLKAEADGVVRYTLVIESAGGARNVTYEGIRCKTWEKRIYALGRVDGSWTEAKASSWQPMRTVSHAEHQWALAEEFFCYGRSGVRDTAEAVRVMRSRAGARAGGNWQ